MDEKAKKLISEARKSIESVMNLLELEEIRVKYLGKKGELTQALRSLGEYSEDERPIIGRFLNEARETVRDMIETRRGTIAAIELENKLKAEDLDITLPGKRPSIGARHPVSVVYEELERIFAHLGFEVLEGPDVELDYNNLSLIHI